MLRCNTNVANFATILSTTKNCSVIFSEQCKSLSSFQKQEIESIIKEQALLFGLLDSIEIAMELFSRTGLYSTVLFKQHDNDVIEVLL